MEVYAIVNAANNELLRGSGVCGAIFAKAGFELGRDLAFEESSMIADRFENIYFICFGEREYEIYERGFVFESMGKKIVIDTLMLILMLLEYSKLYTGQLLHEVFGILLLTLFISHNILNINFIKDCLKETKKMQ